MSSDRPWGQGPANSLGVTLNRRFEGLEFFHVVTEGSGDPHCARTIRDPSGEFFLDLRDLFVEGDLVEVHSLEGAVDLIGAVGTVRAVSGSLYNDTMTVQVYFMRFGCC